MAFDAFVKDIVENGWNVHGVEVWQDGRLCDSWGDTQDGRYPIYSATKTVTAIAAGLAESDGRLQLDRCVLDYLPCDAVRAMGAEQAEAYGCITLHRLMTMSVAGYPFRPEGESWLGYSLALPLQEPERPRFDYSNIPAYLVGVAVSCAVQEPLGEYLARRLFEPLGIQEPPCMACPEGYFYGASGMELTVNELSRIGLLLAQGGVFDGRRILPEDFVRRATSVQQMNREGGYGYFVWRYRDGFSINGKWKQKCYVLPRRGQMVTYLSDIRDSSHDLKESMERHIFGIG